MFVTYLLICIASLYVLLYITSQNTAEKWSAQIPWWQVLWVAIIAYCSHYKKYIKQNIYSLITRVYHLLFKMCYGSKFNSYDFFFNCTKSITQQRMLQASRSVFHDNTNNLYSSRHSIPTMHSLLHITHLPHNTDRLADIIQQQSEGNISITFHTKLKCASAEAAHYGTVHSWVKPSSLEKRDKGWVQGLWAFKDIMARLLHYGRCLCFILFAWSQKEKSGVCCSHFPLLCEGDGFLSGVSLCGRSKVKVDRLWFFCTTVTLFMSRSLLRMCPSCVGSV